MIRLQFEVDPRFNLRHILSFRHPDRFICGRSADSVRALQSQFQEIFSDTGVAFASTLAPEQPHHLGWKPPLGRLDELVEQALLHPLYQRIQAETLQAAELIRAEWEGAYERSHEIVFDVVGGPLEETLKVFVTHPCLRQGRFLADQRAIAWTFAEDQPHSNVIYLWHEVLHAFLPRGNLGHAVLELVADEELRIRLNGGSYPPFIGHPHLSPIKEILLPVWREYLRRSERDIFKFLAWITPSSS